MFSILIISCVTCLALDYSPASTATPNPAPEILELAQASSTDSSKQSILELGSEGDNVKTLQTQLKELGYYNDLIDGQYGTTTRNAVTKFQQGRGLLTDGVAGSQTRKLLQAEVGKKLSIVASSTLPPKTQTTQQQQSEDRGFVWWLLVAIGILGSVGALLYLVKRFSKTKKVAYSDTSHPESAPRTDTNLITPSSQQPDTTTDEHFHSTGVSTATEDTTSQPTKLLPLENTSRLAKVNIIDELIKELDSPDPTKRRKAIWDLGQQGDSRAIQPLVDLMVDADSQQRSLILAALAEIGSRALKPMNRALAMSLQDESPQVRQNAIRDLTRIYDMMAQISQMLCHAVQDPDAEVQATARYALTQMNRIRALSSESLPENSQK